MSISNQCAPSPCNSSCSKFKTIDKQVDQLSETIEKLLWSDQDDYSLGEALGEKCGVFGCIANGEWPTNLDVAHIICLGLVGLQHRFLKKSSYLKNFIIKKFLGDKNPLE